MCKVDGSGGVWLAPTITGPPTIAFATLDAPGVGGLFERLLCDGSDDGDDPFVVAVVAPLLFSELLLMRERASRLRVGSEYR